MKPKPYRVVMPSGVAWVARFLTEDAAWSRVLATTRTGRDTQANRAVLLRRGWRVKTSEPPAYDLGKDDDNATDRL